MKYNAMIVDDVYAVDALKNQLQSICPNLNICCTTNSMAEARHDIQTHQPEIIFLNISFSGIFDLILSISFTTKKRIIIFTCNPDENFQKKLLANALDFLEKPFSKETLAEVMPKAIRHFELIASDPDAANIYDKSLMNLRYQIEGQQPLEKITIPVRFGYKIIHLSELIYLHSDDKFTILHLTNSQIVVANLEIDRFRQFLSAETFFMINSFTIINFKFLKMRFGGGGKALIMLDGTVLSVSKSRLDEFEKIAGSQKNNPPSR